METSIVASIAGPSGSGKTTLTERLLLEHEIGVPQHVTTRNERIDDKKDFYKYISLPEFLDLAKREKFLVGSNDGVRGYGVLKKDCKITFQHHDTILINSSYKDVYQLQNSTVPVRLVALTFKDLEKSIYERIVNSSRNHDIQDISYRVKSAIDDYEKYFKDVEQFAKVVIYTDICDKDETYELTEKALGFEPYIRKRVH